MYKISAEEARAIREAMKDVKNVNAYRRLQAVALRGEGKHNEEIGERTGFHPDWVGKLTRIFCNEGIEGLVKDGRTGGNNRNMSEIEAAEFLKKFEEEAKKGQVITVEAIAKEYDEAVGKTHSSLSTVYYFLHSHGWRMVTPKQQHPGKASDEVIEASKKLTLSWRK
jgi:transposase